MKILHVTSGIAPSSGGPTRSVKGLCRALSLVGADVTLLVLSGQHEFDNPCGVKVIRGLQPSTFNFQLLTYDLVHLHGLWNPGLHKVCVACRKVGVPYVVSPRGMLDPWALSVKKWKKRLALRLYQRRDLKGAAAFHATAELEASNIRKQGLDQPIIIAPNGVDVGSCEVGRMDEGRVKGEKRAVFVSRLHPGKGLLLLAEAWKRAGMDGWKLRVCGPDGYGHKAEVVAKLKEMGIEDRWEFVGEVNDAEKWKEYAAAEFVAHPSVSENFGITIAEGLAAGRPVLATRGTPWRDLVDFKCGWHVEPNSVEALVAALNEIQQKTPVQLAEMGARGRKLIEDKYTWSAIAKTVLKGYCSLIPAMIGGGS